MIRISIIIPVFNEEKTIIKLLEKVNNVNLDGIDKEVIIIDDCSTDSTPLLLEKNKKFFNHLIKLKINSGKGAAVKGTIAGHWRYILFQDADLEYDPQDYIKLVEPVLRFDADVVMGSRLSASQLTRVYYFWHKLK